MTDYVPPRNPDGSSMTYDQRARMRRETGHDKPWEEQRKLLDAQDRGRAEVETKAKQIAAENAPPRNPYADRVAELQRLYGPEAKRRLKHYEHLAKIWETDQLAV